MCFVAILRIWGWWGWRNCFYSRWPSSSFSQQKQTYKLFQKRNQRSQIHPNYVPAPSHLLKKNTLSSWSIVHKLTQLHAELGHSEDPCVFLTKTFSKNCVTSQTSKQNFDYCCLQKAFMQIKTYTQCNPQHTHSVAVTHLFPVSPLTACYICIMHIYMILYANTYGIQLLLDRKYNWGSTNVSS